MNSTKRICVFCGSRAGERPEYLLAARETGRVLAERGIGVVYGGGNIGLMGAVADAALEAGGEVIGVIPQSLVEREVAHPRCTTMHVTETMHERKAIMNALSDAFIVLPGGIGTFEEMFEIMSWETLGIHSKKLGILNVAGYYDSLVRFLDHSVAEGFYREKHRKLLLMRDDLGELLDAMAV